MFCSSSWESLSYFGCQCHILWLNVEFHAGNYTSIAVRSVHCHTAMGTHLTEMSSRKLYPSQSWCSIWWPRGIWLSRCMMYYEAVLSSCLTGLVYLILGAIYILFLCCFLFFISFQRYLSDCLSQNLPDRSSPDFEGWWNYGCRWLLEIAFRSPKEHHYIGNQFLLVLSTELISVTPVVQPGGLTLGFALHLVKGNQWLYFTPDAVSVCCVYADWSDTAVVGFCRRRSWLSSTVGWYTTETARVLERTVCLLALHALFQLLSARIASSVRSAGYGPLLQTSWRSVVCLSVCLLVTTT